MQRGTSPALVAVLAAVAACHHAAHDPAVTAAPAVASRPAYTPADVEFVSGMISHHAQAVLIAGWASTPAYGAGGAVRGLAERIVVAQTDEIAFLQRWLRERGQPVPPADPRGHRMPGMDHPVLMPGMLTPEQLDALGVARGAEFDRLFLTYMIQHHEGAIVMVDKLLAAQGAAQDGTVFRFAADVHADQTTEIERMRSMLAVLPAGGRNQ